MAATADARSIFTLVRKGIDARAIGAHVRKPFRFLLCGDPALVAELRALLLCGHEDAIPAEAIAALETIRLGAPVVTSADEIRAVLFLGRRGDAAGADLDSLAALRVPIFALTVDPDAAPASPLAMPPAGSWGEYVVPEIAREPLREQISWSDVFVYFGDERCVPPTDEQSNYRMAYKAFLNSVPIPPANVHRVAGEIEPGHAANEYASLLRSALGSAPQFDLVLLGMGPDGHTASLFPGAAPDVDDEALVRAVYSTSQMMWRVTVTPKVINSARTVAFAVEGADKAAALAAVYEGPVDPIKYPAQIVHPSPGRLVWLVDELAAGMLKTRAG